MECGGIKKYDPRLLDEGTKVGGLACGLSGIPDSFRYRSSLNQRIAQ